jgi:hypothetical protein
MPNITVVFQFPVTSLNFIFKGAGFLGSSEWNLAGREMF